uniref:Uncharacterized protein n=1 Tax=Timema douglasi TaxID=61478 RepID=A0A7R8ZJ14_TIMDO|nr:unnamed protein product [Timema douglasi]
MKIPRNCLQGRIRTTAMKIFWHTPLHFSLMATRRLH